MHWGIEGIVEVEEVTEGDKVYGIVAEMIVVIQNKVTSSSGRR